MGENCARQPIEESYRIKLLVFELKVKPQVLGAEGREMKKRESAVSRVLSWTAIHLGRASPRASSIQPGSGAGHSIAPLFGIAPGGV